MISTLEPESAYSAFNLNLVSELAPLHHGAGDAVETAQGKGEERQGSHLRNHGEGGAL